MNNIDHTDLLNIRAISSRGTQLSKIMSYWDAVNRSYPKYVDFINSIKKLESLYAIEIQDRGRYGKVSNTVHSHMSLREKFQYFINPTDKLFLNVLERLKANDNAIGLTITEDDYESIIKEYYFSVLK